MGKLPLNDQDVKEREKFTGESWDAVFERAQMLMKALEDTIHVSVSAQPVMDEIPAEPALSSLGRMTEMSTGDLAVPKSDYDETLNSLTSLVTKTTLKIEDVDTSLKRFRDLQKEVKRFIEKMVPDQPSFVTEANPAEPAPSSLEDKTTMSTGHRESGEAADPSARSEEKEPADQKSTAGKPKKRKRKPKKQKDQSADQGVWTWWINHHWQCYYFRSYCQHKCGMNTFQLLGSSSKSENQADCVTTLV